VQSDTERNVPKAILECIVSHEQIGSIDTEPTAVISTDGKRKHARTIHADVASHDNGVVVATAAWDWVVVIPIPSVWVGNIGRSGRHSRQHYFDAKYVVPELGRAQLALLLIGINDQFNRMVQGEAFETQDVLTLDREENYITTALSLNEERGGWLARSHLLRRGRLFMEWLKLMSPREREIRYLLSHTLPDFYVNGRAMRAARGETLEKLPPMKEPIDEFRRNMTLIIALLRERGTEPVLITQPSMWRNDLSSEEDALLWLGSADGWPPNKEGGPYYAVGAMDAMLALYNDALRDIARDEKAALIDLASLVPRDATVFYDDVHFTEGGAERAARAIADALRGGPAASILAAAE